MTKQLAPTKSRYDSQIREVVNRNTVVSLALAQGFNAFLPVYDGGVDFILYREADNVTRKVQLKGRWMIDRKYKGRDIWMAFPIRGEWYLMPHDEMLALAEAEGKTLKSISWTEGGAYSWRNPSKAMIAHCQKYSFAPIAKIVSQAAAEESA